jgi:methionyl-tRNA formyltransferase
MSLPRIIFAGTPDFAVASLKVLLTQPVDIAGVYTQPDRAAGRGKKLQQSPVKICALDAGLPVYQPENFKLSPAREALEQLNADLMIVVAYGLILPKAILNAPRLGCVNIHASLLPRWRGAAPIQRAIESGDPQTGVCLMQMDKGLDTGPVLAKITYDIKPGETGGQLHDILSALGAKLLQNHLSDILEQRLTPTKQAQTGPTYAHKLNKDETLINWKMSAKEIANKVRAFNPWPVMSSRINEQAIRIHCADHELDSDSDNVNTRTRPGEIIHASATGIRVATGEGNLNITRLQKPGGKILDAGDFLNGFLLKAGQRFE